MIRKKLFFLALIFCICACTMESPFEPEYEDVPKNTEIRYIMTFETRGQMEIAHMIFDTLDYSIFYVAENMATLIVDIPERRSPKKIFRSASGDEFSAMYIEEDELIYELLPTDIYEYNVLNNTAQWFWNMNMIQAVQIWFEQEWTGNSVNIIIIDSGLCPDYRSMPVFAAFDSSMSFNPYTDSTDIEGTFGHGSHVFAITAGQSRTVTGGIFQGVAPGANVGMIKMFEGRWASRSMAVKSVDKAISYNPEVISMSWGGVVFSPSLSLLFAKGAEKGIAFVAAAGNTGRSPIIYPARHSQVIAVGAVNVDTARAYFSSYGEELEIMAPGRDILSFLGCEPGEMSGTSMAAPHVAGAIALYIQKVRQITAGGGNGLGLLRPPLMVMRTDLHNSSKDMGADGWDFKTSFGLLQIKDFLDQIQE